MLRPFRAEASRVHCRPLSRMPPSDEMRLMSVVIAVLWQHGRPAGRIGSVTAFQPPFSKRFVLAWDS